MSASMAVTRSTPLLPMPPRTNEQLHDLRNGLARLSACAEVLELRDGGLTEGQQAGLDKMRSVIAEMATLVGDMEGGLDTALSDEAPVTSAEPSTADPDTRREGELRPNGPATVAEACQTLPSRCSGHSDGASARVTISVPGAPPIGTTVAGSYRVLRLLGRGGMGSVWLARDGTLNRDVALKLVDHEAWGGRDARAVFLREARAMAKVKHPNVVTIHAFGEHAGVPYFVMEYVPGTSLERLLAAHEHDLGFDQAIHILDQVCRGVEAIHRAGALHCDIKPGNVLIGASFRVAVADLGLARAVGETGGMKGGTPGYIAPEVVAGSEYESADGPDERADVYAVGALAYNLLTGQPAFAAESVNATLQRQLDGDLEAPSSIAEVPAAFDDILTRALHRDPRARHASAEALRRELSAACDALVRHYPDTTVFVVDDDDELRRHASALVSRALPGARVYPFRDGRDALQGAEQLGMPDIAVVDLEMPSINGVELTAAFKAQPDSGVDVVMVSGVASARDWELLQRLGASGFLLKPVDESELSALMRRLAIADRKPHPDRRASRSVSSTLGVFGD